MIKKTGLCLTCTDLTNNEKITIHNIIQKSEELFGNQIQITKSNSGKNIFYISCNDENILRSVALTFDIMNEEIKFLEKCYAG